MIELIERQLDWNQSPHNSPHISVIILLHVTNLCCNIAVQNQTQRLNVEVKPHGLQRFIFLFLTAYSHLPNIT